MSRLPCDSRANSLGSSNATNIVDSCNCSQRADDINVIASNSTVYLRKIKTSDAAFIKHLTNQKGWLEQIGDKEIRSLSDAKKFIKSGPQKTYKRFGFGLYLVVCCEQDLPVGVCGLLKRSYLNAPDLGYAISQEYYRRGFAHMSCELVLAKANKLSNAKYLYASTKKTNCASQNLLLKLGFTQDGALLSQDGDENLLLYKRVLA